MVYSYGKIPLTERYIIRINASMKADLHGMPASFIREELDRAITKWYRLNKKKGTAITKISGPRKKIEDD